MQDQYTKEELSEQINLKWRGGNSLVNATLTEEQQADVAHYCKSHTVTNAAAYFQIAKSRVKLICQKYEIEPAKRYVKVHKLSQANLKRIEAMVGKEYNYMTFERLITGYTLHEDSVVIHTRTLQYGQSKDVNLKFEGIGKELDYFIKWNTVR